MRRTGSRMQELALPIASIVALRHALSTAVGPDTAAKALREAGYAAGDALATILTGDAEGNAPVDLSADRFWHRLSDLFAARGWGHLTHEHVHEGVGALDASDWVEADPDSGVMRPSCHFTTGMLANLLTRAAGSDVAVLEVECRSRGDLNCRFLFGGQPALESVYELLRTGKDVEGSLAELV